MISRAVIILGDKNNSGLVVSIDRICGEASIKNKGGNKTPAQKAGLQYPFRNWMDIVKTKAPTVSTRQRSTPITVKEPLRITPVKRLGITPKRVFPLTRSRRRLS